MALDINLIEEGLLVPSISETGAIVSFSASAPLDITELTVAVTAVQSGSGDPSPSNVRPISGWSGANVSAVGANVCGGDALKDGVLASITTATTGTDSNGDYVSYAANSANNKPFFTTFKPNTQYTLIMRLAKDNATTSTNIQVRYTDNSYSLLARASTTANVPETVVFTSVANKTIQYIGGAYQSGTTYLYYDDCGVYEGVLTASDFVPYNGTTYPFSFGTTVYGGTLNVLTGTLTVTHGYVDLGTLTWKYATDNQNPVFYAEPSQFAGALPLATNNVITCKSEIYKAVVNSSFADFANRADSDYTVAISSQGTKQRCLIRDSRYTTTASFKTAMNGVKFVYELATPQTVQLTATQVQTLVGQNNVWADCGDVALKTSPVFGKVMFRLMEEGISLSNSSPLLNSAPLASPVLAPDEDALTMVEPEEESSEEPAEDISEEPEPVEEEVEESPEEEPEPEEEEISDDNE